MSNKGSTTETVAVPIEELLILIEVATDWLGINLLGPPVTKVDVRGLPDILGKYEEYLSSSSSEEEIGTSSESPP